MKVKCIDDKIVQPHGDFTLNAEYEVVEVWANSYCVIDDVKDRNYVDKRSFELLKIKGRARVDEKV